MHSSTFADDYTLRKTRRMIKWVLNQDTYTYVYCAHLPHLHIEAYNKGRMDKVASHKSISAHIRDYPQDVCYLHTWEDQLLVHPMLLDGRCMCILIADSTGLVLLLLPLVTAWLTADLMHKMTYHKTVRSHICNYPPDFTCSHTHGTINFLSSHCCCMRGLIYVCGYTIRRTYIPYIIHVP